ncbi:MAG: GNAT family N-acetyltransferase [Desulfobacterales bacterium]|nr:GNAT family N-acetyltransferase [Desulfobacterales bacterium]
MNVQDAVLDDIPAMALHHRKMFEEIWEKNDSRIERIRGEELATAYRDKLNTQMPEGLCKAWVIKKDNEVIASGAITLVSFVPSPSDLNHTVAYLHSIYTEKRHRKKQCARMILDRAVQYCRENGIARVFLNASDAGKSLYESAGFSSSPDTMRLFVT